MCRTKYTDELAKKICDYLQAGATDEAAYRSCGIGRASFYVWQNSRPAFRDMVLQAKAKCELNMTFVVTKHAKDDPKYALEWLKRRRRKEWGDNVQHGADRRLRELMANLLGTDESGDAGSESDIREDEED